MKDPLTIIKSNPRERREDDDEEYNDAEYYDYNGDAL